MNTEQLRIKVEHCLGNAQISEAIDAVLDFAQQHRLRGVKQNALLLRSQYFALKQRYEIRGMLHHQEYQVEFNRIAAGVLSLSQEGIVKDRQKQNVLIWFLPTVIILLGGVTYWQWYDASSAVAEAPHVKVISTDSTLIKGGTATDTTSENTKTSITPDPPEPNNPSPKPLPNRKSIATSPKIIEMIITIDNKCWDGSEVFVNGKSNGIIVGTKKQVRVPYKADGYAIYVRRKDGKKSSSELYSPEDPDNTINITCKH